MYELIGDVDDEKHFLMLVDAFLKERIAEVKVQKENPVDNSGRGPLGWGNHTIEDFLDAVQARAESTNIGATQDPANASPWRRCAAFLYCGKIYE